MHSKQEITKSKNLTATATFRSNAAPPEQATDKLRHPGGAADNPGSTYVTE
jgi:hypothetical protein